MFAKTIIDSDAFLEMPLSSQLLYFHLHMRADDEGFINKPKTIMRMLGSKDDDMNVLIAKKFIIPFESGVVVIKHWRIHNYLQSGRYIETKYLEEKSSLELDENNAYRKITGKTPEVYLASIEKSSVVESSVVKSSKESGRFTPPTQEEVSNYMNEIFAKDDSQRFIDYYTSNGWMVGRNKMKDWKASVRNWVSRNNDTKDERKATKTGSRFLDLMEEENEQS